MAQVMEPHVMKVRTSTDGLPGVIELSKVGPRLLAGDDPGAVGKARESGEEPDRRRREQDYPRTRLRVGKPQFGFIEIHVLPAFIN